MMVKSGPEFLFWNSGVRTCDFTLFSKTRFDYRNFLGELSLGYTPVNNITSYLNTI